jgi:hypothetical protein
MDTELALVIVDVQKNLGGFPDAGHGLEGVSAPEEGEIGHCIEFEKVRARYYEEISIMRSGPGQERSDRQSDIVRHPFPRRNDVVTWVEKTRKPLGLSL